VPLGTSGCSSGSDLSMQPQLETPRRRIFIFCRAGACPPPRSLEPIKSRNARACSTGNLNAALWMVLTDAGSAALCLHMQRQCLWIEISRCARNDRRGEQYDKRGARCDKEVVRTSARAMSSRPQGEISYEDLVAAPRSIMRTNPRGSR
jgi:hypothetical protein